MTMGRLLLVATRSGMRPARQSLALARSVGPQHRGSLACMAGSRHQVPALPRRALGTSSASSTSGTGAVQTRPPLVVRASLVGSAVALGTPVFAASGVAVMWARTVHNLNPITKMVVYSVVGGGLGTLLLSVVKPFLLNHSEIVLPFAVANCLTATGWYLVLEATVGLQAMQGDFHLTNVLARVPGALNTLPKQLLKASVPLGGPLIGVLTASTAGLLWEPLAAALWPAEIQAAMAGPNGAAGQGNELGWLLDLHLETLTWVQLPVGLLAGYGVHGLLSPFVVGNLPGTPRHWTATALPLLGAITAASAWYFSQCGHYDSRELFWERRLDPATGGEVAYNPRSGETLHTRTKVLAVGDSSKMVLAAADFLRNPFSVARSRLLTQGRADDREARMLQRAGARFPTDDSVLPLALLEDHQRMHYLIDLLIRLKGLQMNKFRGGGTSLAQAGTAAERDEAALAHEFGIGHEMLLDEATTSEAAAALCRRVKRRFGLALDELLDHAEMAIRVEASAREMANSANAGGAKTKTAKKKAMDEVQKLRDEMYDLRAHKSKFINREDANNAVAQAEGGGQLDVDTALDMVCVLSRHLGWLRLRMEKELGYVPHKDKIVIDRVQTRQTNEWIERTMDTLLLYTGRAAMAGLAYTAVQYYVLGGRRR